VQVQGQGDDHRFHVGIIQQRLVSAVFGIVNFDVLPRFVLALPAIHALQARPRGDRRRTGPVAVKGAVNAGRPNVRYGHDLKIVGIDGADQHVAFVAGADHSDAQGIAHFSVTEVGGAQTGGSRNRRPGQHAFQKITAMHAGGLVIIVAADLTLFRR
jgi:hypothetical protein